MNSPHYLIPILIVIVVLVLVPVLEHKKRRLMKVLHARKILFVMNIIFGFGGALSAILLFLSSVGAMPDAFFTVLPLSLLDNFPLHDAFFKSYLFVSIAQLIIVAAPSILAFALRKNEGYNWGRWCLLAAFFMLVWSTVQLAFMLNVLSVVVYVLAILYYAASVKAVSAGPRIAFSKAKKADTDQGTWEWPR